MTADETERLWAHYDRMVESIGQARMVMASVPGFPDQSSLVAQAQWMVKVIEQLKEEPSSSPSQTPGSP